MAARRLHAGRRDGGHLGIDLPENRDYETVAGYVLSHMHHLPATGECVDAQGWRFEVVDLDGRRIDKVIATRLPGARAAEAALAAERLTRKRGGAGAAPQVAREKEWLLGRRIQSAA